MMKTFSKIVTSGHAESGFSLVSTLLALGFVGFLVTTLSRIQVQAAQGVSHNSQNVELIAYKQTILNELDCHRTLGSPTTLPVNCNSVKNVILYDRYGKSLSDLGAWQARGSCNTSNLSLQISVESKEVSRLTKNKISKNDAFGGVTLLCRSYFQSNPPPTNVAGFFQKRIKANQTLGDCRIPNPYTNNCQCPAGFKSMAFYEHYTGNTLESCHSFYGDDLPASLDRCGVQSFMCLEMR